MNNVSHVIAKDFRGLNYKNTSFKKLKKFPFIKGKQCLYVLDWKLSKVTFSHGIYDMLGYDADEFTKEVVLGKIHPEDKLIVNRIIQGAVSMALETNISLGNSYLNLSFRIQKKDGSYIKVLRHSFPYQTDDHGQLISSCTLLSDISFMNPSNKVEWEMFSDNLDISMFKNKIYKEFENFFTKRELEIVQLIKQNFSNKQIAEHMFISYQTVATHRKNILNKSNCHSVSQLLDFSYHHGII